MGNLDTDTHLSDVLVRRLVEAHVLDVGWEAPHIMDEPAQGITLLRSQQVVKVVHGMAERHIGQVHTRLDLERSQDSHGHHHKGGARLKVRRHPIHLPGWQSTQTGVLR